MTVTVVFADATDGYVTAYGATYAQARAGTGTFYTSTSGANLVYGQQLITGQYGVTQAFLRFSYTVPSGEVVTSAQIALAHTAGTATGITRDLELRSYNWATPVTSAAYRPSTALAALPLLAGATGVNAAGGKVVYAGGSGLRDAVAAGSSVAVVALSSRSRSGVTPTTEETSTFYAADQLGTVNDPILVFTSVARSTLFGVLGAQVRLPDGSWALVESDGAATPVLTLRRHAGGAVTTLATLPAAFAAPLGAQGIALATDAAGNIYVVGRSTTAGNTLSAQRYAAGTWAAGTVQSVALPSYDAPINNVACAWQSTDGTGSLVVVASHVAGVAVPGTSATDEAWALIDCATLTTRAIGYAVGSVLPPAPFVPPGSYNLHSNDTGSGLDVAAVGTVGYAAGHARTGSLGTDSPTAVGRWEATATDLVNQASSISNSFGMRDAGSKIRVIPFGSNGFAEVSADGYYGIQVRFWQYSGGTWTTLAPDVQLGSESISLMPDNATVGTSLAWDAVYVESDNRLWIYYCPTGDRSVRRTSISLSTYQASRDMVSVTTVGASGGTNLAIRVQRGSGVVANSLLTVAHRASGGALSTTYVVDSFNVAPTPAQLAPRANYDATTAAALTWTFQDPNFGDGQTARQVQVVNTATSVTVIDTGKVANAVGSYTIAANALSNGNAYQWRVMTWDQYDVASPWSAWGTFSTSAGGAVTVIDPATDNPAGVITDDYVVRWSVTGTVQAAYRVALVRVSDGVTVSDTGWVTSVATSATVAGMASDTQYEVRVTVRNAAAVSSGTATRRITPSYSAPDAPTVDVEDYGLSGYLLVSVVNPTPTGDRPVPTSNELSRRRVGESTWTLLATLAPGVSYRDYAVPSGTAYEYRARAVV